MKRLLGFTVVCVLFLIPASFSVNGGHLGVQQACAQGDWRKAFDDICAKTNDAMNLSDEELKALVEKAESLKPVIEKLDESERKVFLRRLQKCRDLFDFVLSTRKK